MWKSAIKLSKDRLFKNTGWMLTSEAIAKISRLLTVVAMAALLSPNEFGIAALAVACHELIRVFSRAGAGARVIQCNDKDLPTIAGNASFLQWATCSALAAAQFYSADAIGHFYSTPDLALLLKIMAITYLCYPLVAIKVFMVQRQNSMRYFALGCAACLTIDNLSTVILLLLDVGILSVAYAKVLSAFAWVCIFGCNRVKTHFPRFNLTVMPSLALLTINIFATESLRVLRSQIDILVAARLLPPELFGLYSFAKNAGVGLTQSIVTAYISGLYPYLCEQYRSGAQAIAKVKAFQYCAGISSLFIIQCVLAPLYIDLCFADRWKASSQLVIILCLSGIPAIFTDTFAMMLRAQNRAFNEALLLLYCVSTLGIMLLIFQPGTAIALATTVTITSFLWCAPLLLSWFLGRTNYSTVIANH